MNHHDPLVQAVANMTTNQYELHKARNNRLRAICHTGWVDEGDLDNDLNITVPDQLGSQHYYVAGWRVGWVQRHHSMPVWIANWLVNEPGAVYGLTWLDPYAGDSAGHIFPTVEQAKAKVETAFEQRLGAKWGAK